MLVLIISGKLLFSDLLDYGNYKKALQESEKVLRKHPDSTNAKVIFLTQQCQVTALLPRTTRNCAVFELVQ